MMSSDKSYMSYSDVLEQMASRISALREQQEQAQQEEQTQEQAQEQAQAQAQAQEQAQEGNHVPNAQRTDRQPLEEELLNDLMQDVRQYDDDWFEMLAVEDMKMFLDGCYIEIKEGDGV